MIDSHGPEIAMTVRDWVLGGQSDLLFLPLLHKFAAQLEQVEIREMLTDPGIMTRCLRDAQRLFGYDGVINNFDPTLEAEACGCKVNWTGAGPDIAIHAAQSRGLDGLNTCFESEGRLPTVLEATKRLRCETTGPVSLLAGLTGPVTLAYQLLGDSFSDELADNSLLAQDLIEFASDVSVTLCRQYCDLGVDGVLVIEGSLEHATRRAELIRELRAPLKTLRNVTQHYGVPLVLVARGSYDIPDLRVLRSLPIDGLSIGSIASPMGAHEAQPGLVRILGFGLSTSLFLAPADQGTDAIREQVEVLGRYGHFLTSQWEVPLNTTPQQFHQIVRVTAEYRSR
jgi:uroporphyrinogen-III decarboxylase